jgi:hypothetical protein
MARVRLILNRYKNKIFSVNKIDSIEKIMRISILRFQLFKEKSCLRMTTRSLN